MKTCLNCGAEHGLSLFCRDCWRMIALTLMAEVAVAVVHYLVRLI